MISMLEISFGGLLLFGILFAIANDTASGQSIIALAGLPIALGPIVAGIYLLQMTEDGRFVNVVVLSIVGLLVLYFGLWMIGEEGEGLLTLITITTAVLLGLGLCCSAYYLTRSATKAQFRQ